MDGLAAATMAACAKVRSNREHCWTFVRNSKQTGIKVSRLWGAACQPELPERCQRQDAHSLRRCDSGGGI